MNKIYFLHAPSLGLLKVGRSNQPVRRIAEVRDISPAELDLIGVATGTSDTEARIHRAFGDLRVRGEWFQATQELLDYARFHCFLDLWEDMGSDLRAKALETLTGIPEEQRSA